MSPQRSNRFHLIEGTLRCLERYPPSRVTARVIAKESGANLASIIYHFGSKDELITEAVIEGLDRWLAEIAQRLDQVEVDTPKLRFWRAFEAVETTRSRHEGLARNYLAALVMAQHNHHICEVLTAGLRRTRGNIADVLGLGSDDSGRDAAGLTLALFNGLLYHTLLDPALAIEGDRMRQGLARLRRMLPDNNS